MSAILEHPASHGHDDHHDHHAPTGWRRWVYATNHKDIGTLYLLFSLTMLMIGGVLALLIRAELFQPGLQMMQPEFFNQLTTMHGLIMVFGAIMPGFVGFANWMIPLQVGAADMAFARMNNFSFWLLIPAGLMMVGSFFMPGGAPAAGWTLYAPLTLQMGPSMDAGIFAVHILGASSIMGVGPGVAEQGVVEGVAGAVDVARPGQLQVFDVRAEGEADAAVDLVGARVLGLRHRVAGVVHGVGVVPHPARHGVRARAAVEAVAAAAARQQ